MTLTCPDCGADMTLRNSRYGRFYGCTRYPECKAAHGAHPDGRPLGTPANKETKGWRIKAHDAFDAIWKGTQTPRKKAYQWLQVALGMSQAECHIGMFDIKQCQRVIAACERFHPDQLEELPPLPSSGYWKKRNRKKKRKASK